MRSSSSLVKFYKRAQILIADLWACFEGKGYGQFHDIDTLTMFADYRYTHTTYLIAPHHDGF